MKVLPMIILVMFGLFGTVAAATANPLGTITKEVIEMTLERAAKQSGRAVLRGAEKKAASKGLESLATKHGSDVLKVVEDGGMELLEAVPKYGDEVIAMAARVSPAARRALAGNVSELLPLARRVGPEALELEAKVPGQAARIFGVFGDDAGRAVARTAKTEDLPRLLKYGESADSPATRQVLLERYAKEGASLFERIPPEKILAFGLTAAMLYGTHQITAPDRAMADAMRDNPAMAMEVLKHSKTLWAGVILIIALFLLWRFRLMPWHGRSSSGKAKTGP